MVYTDTESDKNSGYFKNNRKRNGLISMDFISLYDSHDSTKDKSPTSSENILHICEYCENKVNSKFIILDCGHIFHIKCLVENHLKDIYNYPVIDDEYFSHKVCSICKVQISREDLLFLHTKYITSTDKDIDEFTTSMNKLEEQMNNLKNEIKTCFDYKHKLQQSREKSKQIIAIMNF